MRKRRFVCVHIPAFALALCAQREPELCAGPLALVTHPGGTGMIRACNDKAAANGVRNGLTVAQGRSLCGDLKIRTGSAEHEHQQSRRVLARLQGLGPEVEEVTPGTYFLVSPESGRLHKNEKTFAKRSIAVVRSYGFAVTVGIARSKTAAKIAAGISGVNTFTIIPPGCERKFLRELDIDLLEPRTEVSTSLHALGLSTGEQVAALPAAELARRFGRAGVSLSRLIRGDEPVNFIPEAPPLDLTREWHPAFPVTRSALLTARVQQMLSDLFSQLKQQGRACRQVTLELQLEKEQKEKLTLAVRSATLSVREFVCQLHHRLEQTRIASGVTGLVVAIDVTARARAEQLELVRRPTIQRGAKSERSGRPTTFGGPNSDRTTALHISRLVSSALPEESFQIDLPHAPAAKRKDKSANAAPGDAAYTGSAVAGLRLLQPAQQVTVKSRGRDLQSLFIKRRWEQVEECTGPWELSGRWWENDFSRLYYEVQTRAERRYLCFFDRLSSGWFLQGIFD